MIAATSAVHPDELLPPADVLEQRDLVAPAGRGAAEVRAGVRCGRPLTYPVRTDDLPTPLRVRATAGRRYFGVLFAMDLVDVPAGHRLIRVRSMVTLADDRVIAAAVHGDGGRLGVHFGFDPVPGEPDGGEWAATPLGGRAITATQGRSGLLSRLGVRRERPSAATFGVLSPHFGWIWADRTGTSLPPAYGMHALLEVPAGVTDLRGDLAVEADLIGTGFSASRRRASTGSEMPFTALLDPAPATEGGASVRLCVAVDVVGYSSRTDADASVLQRDLVRMLGEARTAAGIDPTAVRPQPQGDGEFTVLPTGIDESVVIPLMIGRLTEALAARNASRPPGDRMRLRMALHRGLVREEVNGWIGRAAIAVHRILDSPPLRTAVIDYPGADLVLGVPDALFQDVLRHSAGPPPGAAFTAMTVDLPAKNFREHGWWWAAS